MKLSKEKIMREAARFLKRTAEYQNDRDVDKAENYQIQYILLKEGRTQPETVIAYAYSNYREQEIFFYPVRKEETVSYNWPSNFESDLLEPLGNGYEIVGMTLECHSAVWGMIEESCDKDSKCSKGVQTYLSYCKQNGITKQLLQEKVLHEGKDIMRLYKRERETKKVQER